ncbi:MAG: hypothetical protein AAGH79_08935, partial [Bacteroidota bacterium]
MKPAFLFLCLLANLHCLSNTLDTLPLTTCDSFIVLLGEGNFDDGSGPTPYSPNLDYTFLWVNTTVNSDKRTWIVFETIDLGPGDTLLVYKGEFGCGRPFYTLTETDTQFAMLLNEPTFNMLFTSDESGEGQGWEFYADVTNLFSHPEEYGEALTIHREPINNVAIPIFASSFVDTFFTFENGQTWDYWGYYPEYPYSTYAFKTADDIQNGLTTLDLVRIKKHILQVDPMQNPYRLLAADVNDSESITTLDLVAIQKVILGIETEFPNQQIWKFV